MKISSVYVSNPGNTIIRKHLIWYAIKTHTIFFAYLITSTLFSLQWSRRWETPSPRTQNLGALLWVNSDSIFERPRATYDFFSDTDTEISKSLVPSPSHFFPLSQENFCCRKLKSFSIRDCIKGLYVCLKTFLGGTITSTIMLK